MVADLYQRPMGGCFLFSGSLVWPVGSPGSGAGSTSGDRAAHLDGMGAMLIP
jgi:hypothetical protein